MSKYSLPVILGSSGGFILDEFSQSDEDWFKHKFETDEEFRDTVIKIVTKQQFNTELANIIKEEV